MFALPSDRLGDRVGVGAHGNEADFTQLVGALFAAELVELGLAGGVHLACDLARSKTDTDGLQHALLHTPPDLVDERLGSGVALEQSELGDQLFAIDADIESLADGQRVFSVAAHVEGQVVVPEDDAVFLVPAQIPELAKHVTV